MQIELGIDDLLPFGKYKGSKISDIIIKDPLYVEWLTTNYKNNYYFGESVLEELDVILTYDLNEDAQDNFWK